jgi:hypothetical protein
MRKCSRRAPGKRAYLKYDSVTTWLRDAKPRGSFICWWLLRALPCVSRPRADVRGVRARAGAGAGRFAAPGEVQLVPEGDPGWLARSASPDRKRPPPRPAASQSEHMRLPPPLLRRDGMLMHPAVRPTRLLRPPSDTIDLHERTRSERRPQRADTARGIRAS